MKPKDLAAIADGSRAMMATDLTRGAFSGKETYFYYNSGSYATPAWVLMARARNIQVNDGPELSDVNFHGSANTSQIPGYQAFNGSFEYVRKKGTDTVWDFLDAARAAGDIVHVMLLNGPENDANSKGWMAPIVLGEASTPANGGDPVVATIPFGLADAYDGSDNQIGREPASGSAGP